MSLRRAVIFLRSTVGGKHNQDISRGGVMAEEAKRRLFRMPQGGAISWRDLFFAWWPALLFAVLGFAVAAMFIKPAPPDRVVIATGAIDGAYYHFARRYAEIFARYGITLEVRATSGSVENLKLLADEDTGVDIGFVQGGIPAEGETTDLQSMGAMYYEPVWVFYRGGETIERLSQLKGKRLAIGPEGSGTRKLAIALLQANGVATPDMKGGNLTGEAAARALREGQLDAAVFVASAQSKAVAGLLRERDIRLVSLVQAEGYARHFPFLSVVTLPRGSIDLKQDIPAHDVNMVATTANLVVRDTLHPAVVNLMSAAAKEVHAAPSLFSAEDKFPSSRDVDFKMHPHAERYYKNGLPFLQRFMPFWAATLFDRMMVLLLPLLAIVLPLVRVLPALYQWRIRSRIFRNYGELKYLESDVANAADYSKNAEFYVRLDAIEARVNRLRVPLAHHEQLYMLRWHVDLVRTRIAKLSAPVPPAG